MKTTGDWIAFVAVITVAALMFDWFLTILAN